MFHKNSDYLFLMRPQILHSQRIGTTKTVHSTSCSYFLYLLPKYW